MNKDMLLQSIMELDFMAVDLQLYLDTHPKDILCMKKYNEVIEESKILRKEYENLYGPLSSFRNTQTQKQKWIDEPWPHEMKMSLKVYREDY